MATLHIVYDPHNLIRHDPVRGEEFEMRVATLAIADDLAGVDIYNVAKKLAELLLEQLPSEPQ